jgi:hypothetical protein
LNRFHHGGTSLVVGRWVDGSAAVLASLDLKPLSGKEFATAELSICPEMLTAQEACEDLRALHTLLANGYAGFPDLDWHERGQGSSWEMRTARFEGRLQGQAHWSPWDFFDLLVQYLEPVQDHHFQMRLVAPRDGVVESRRTGFIKRRVPYFAEGRVEQDRDGLRLRGLAPDLAAAEGALLVSDVPVIGSPDDAREGVAYLLPALPTEGDRALAAGGKTYLLGFLAAEDSVPPPLDVLVQSGELRLPVHRGRVCGPAPGDGTWRLQWPPTVPIPTLQVKTMVENGLAEMPASADTLRQQPAVLLDLRGNGGGSDMPAMLWCRRFSQQPFDWIASIELRAGVEDPLRKCKTHLGGRLGADVSLGPGAQVAEEPYAGRLVVLLDKNVASSGETFTQLAGQIRGAVLMGENTAGCVDYGNVEPKPVLPHSSLRCAFGRTRFIEDWVRPNREGFGFFPDFWLDTDAPDARIAQWLEPGRE